MLDDMQPIEIGWYDWDYRLAVVAGQHAFVLSEQRGWGKVNPADVSWDGRRFASATDAIDSYVLKWDGIDPIVVMAHVVRGLAPPRPKRYRRYVLVEDAKVLEGRDDFTGNILVEFDDGTMRKINGKELAALSEYYRQLSRWRLSGREGH